MSIMYLLMILLDSIRFCKILHDSKCICNGWCTKLFQNSKYPLWYKWLDFLLLKLKAEMVMTSELGFKNCKDENKKQITNDHFTISRLKNYQNKNKNQLTLRENVLNVKFDCIRGRLNIQKDFNLQMLCMLYLYQLKVKFGYCSCVLSQNKQKLLKPCGHYLDQTQIKNVSQIFMFYHGISLWT